MGKKSKRQNRPKKGGPPGSSRRNDHEHRGLNPGPGISASEGVNLQNFFQRADELLKTLPPEEVVEKIRMGSGPITTALSELATTRASAIANKGLLQRLADAGVISVLLDFLNRADQSISDIFGVTRAAGDKGSLTADGNGNIVCVVEMTYSEEGILLTPSLWCYILSNLLANWEESYLNPESLQECRMQVARKIGTLVKVMCDDMGRTCYQETSHWHQTFMPFLQLINGLVHTKDTVPIILEYDGLLRILVQCIFWLEQREDVLRESMEHKMSKYLLNSDVAGCASSTLSVILRSQYSNEDGTLISAEARERIRSIGSTVVVNELFDPSCEVSFMVGLLFLLKTRKGASERPWLRECARYLVENGCADKAVIREILNLGFNHAEDDVKDATFILCASDRMLWKADPERLVDIIDESLAAHAVNKGLFHVIVKLLRSFGSTNSGVVQQANQLVHYIHSVSTRGKLPKALANLSDDGNFMSDLLSLGDVAQKTGSDDLMELVLAMRSELLLKRMKPTSPECSNCQKILARNEIRYCSRCNYAVFCNKECQIAHWDAHKSNCVKADIDFAKRRRKSSDESKQLAGELLNHNARSFFIEAIIKGLDILDCYVLISLQMMPPTIHVLQPGSQEEESIFEELAQSEPDVQKDFQNFRETAVHVCGGDVLPVCVFTQLSVMFTMDAIDNFMGMPLPEAQRILAHEMKGELACVQTNPDERDDYMRKLQLQRVAKVLSAQTRV